MRITSLILVLLLSLSSANAAQSRAATWWSNFCERHLIAEDPYQKHFRQKANVEEIVTEYRKQGAARYWAGTSVNQFGEDEYEMILWVMMDKLQQPITTDERLLIQTALEDYPSGR